MRRSSKCNNFPAISKYSSDKSSVTDLITLSLNVYLYDEMYSSKDHNMLVSVVIACDTFNLF